MKKLLLVLGMITCLVGLSACGAVKEEEVPMMTAADAEELGQQVVETINQYVVLQAQNQITDALLLGAVEGWEAAAKDMGNYVGIISTESDITAKDAVIDVKVEGSSHNAVVQIVLDTTHGITGISTNVEYTFGEKMEKAALNTLLGMGTVFVVLILISLIISCFIFIPKLQAKMSKKPNKEEIKAVAVDHTIAQIIEKEELSDDLELVAVISAAIAASEGAASTDGFVVRSIKRAGNKWQSAGRASM